MSTATPMDPMHRLLAYWRQPPDRVPTLANLSPAQRRRHEKKLARLLHPERSHRG